MGCMVLDPNNDRGHQIDVTPEKGQEYQAVRIFGKDNLTLITLGALLILSPFVKNLLERIGVPALVGYIPIGFLIGLIYPVIPKTKQSVTW